MPDPKTTPRHRYDQWGNLRVVQPDQPKTTERRMMICPYCKRAGAVQITRHATASPQHVDLGCECERCGETWQAAEDYANG